MLFQPRSALVVSPYWSTSPDKSVTTHYQGLVLYYILPDPNRTAWHARDINDFNIDMTAHEHLYPRNSAFTVVSATCVRNQFWNVTLIENGASSVKASDVPKPRAPLAVQKCVS